MKAQIWNENGWIYVTDPAVLKTKFKEMLLESGFKILDFTEHYFEPQGYTCLFLLGESHFAVHTFPEEEKTYIELSSCNKKMFDTFKKMVFESGIGY